MPDSARQEDFLFAEHVLRKGFATEEQVEECLKLLERLRGEMQLEETLRNILLKKGYLAPAQAVVIDHAINPAQAGAAKNQIEGYQLLSRLGAGAMGSVYKAIHLKLKIPVALKVLRVDLAKSRTQVERLKREAQLAARLNHPNIVRSLDVGESNGFHYFAMEYVDGQTVRQLLRKGRLRDREALRIVRDVARALEHAHGQGVIHRDVKPGNIILTAEGQVKLADLGLARGQEPSDLTMEHASIGTPQYVAIEQVRSGSNATERSDLFSLGATLYHMVTGRPPFSGESLGEIIRKVLALEFDPPESVVPDLSLDVVYLIHRLMRANPRERYPDATTLIADLQRVESGHRIAPPDFKGDYRAFLERRRAKRLALGLGAAAVLTLSILFTWKTIRERQERDSQVRRCTEANESGRAEARGVATTEELRGLIESLNLTARESRCEAEQVPDLTERRRHLASDLTALEEGERLLKGSGAPEADYRLLAASLARIEATLPGARRRLQEMAGELARRSRDEAFERFNGQYVSPGFPDATTTLRELERFADDLDRRYLSVSEAWVARPRADLQRLSQLDQSYRDADAKIEPMIRAAVEVNNFSNAQKQAEIRRMTRLKAWNRAHEQGTHPEFLRHWPYTDRRVEQLQVDEQSYWNSLAAAARTLMETGRPDEAETKLNEFRGGAEHTRMQLKDLLDRVIEAKETLVADQKRALGMIEARFKSELVERAYALAARNVNESVAQLPAERWILEAGGRRRQLVARAEAVRGLLDRLLPGVRALPSVSFRPVGEKGVLVAPGSAFSADPGGDPEHLRVHTQRFDHTLSLRDFDRETLDRIFAFDPSRPADIAAAGYFHAAEGYRALRSNEKYDAADLWRTAAAQLTRSGDEWAADLRAELNTLDSEITTRENEARVLLGKFDEACKENEHVRALLLGERLKALSWTRVVKPQLPNLEAKLLQLDGLARYDKRRTQSGVPLAQFQLDPSTGRLVIRYTGKVWHPLGEMVPANVDREKWLEEKERAYWFKWFRDFEHEEKEWPALYERARLQLLDWDDATVEAAPRGGYRLRAGVYENHERWWSGLRGPPLIASVRNHFRADRDWSFECTVAWDGPEPVIFTLAAGRIQATLGYLSSEYGGVAGCALYEDSDILDGWMPHFSDFHWRMVKPGDGEDKRRRKRIGQPHLAYWDNFVPGESYRLRMEREMDRVRFYIVRESEWAREGFQWASSKETILLERKSTSQQIEKATRVPEDAPLFRFFGRVRFTLTDVIVTGILRSPNES